METTKTERGIELPVCTKKVKRVIDQTRELGRGAGGIKSLSRAAHKRVRISQA